MPFRHSAELRPNESPRALLGNPKYHRHSSGRGGERAWIIKESTSFLFKNVGPRLSAANRTITGGSVTKPRTAHKRIPNLGNTRGRALPFCSPPRHATPRHLLPARWLLWNPSIVPTSLHYHVLHSRARWDSEEQQRIPRLIFDMGWAQGWAGTPCMGRTTVTVAG